MTYAQCGAKRRAHEGEKVEFALQAGAASPHRASSGHPELPGATPVRVKRIIGIDPGRVNLIFAAEKINGKTKTYRLTKKCYYNSSGMTKARKRNAKWQKQIEREEKIFSTTSPKTSDPNVFDEFLRDYISVYHILWPHKTQAKYSRERFRCYTLKRKTLDLFFNNFSKDKSLPKPYIAYGGAKFSATSRNEISAPTSSMLTRCRNKFPTKIVDEFRTTKVCFDCESVMSPIREVRGMTRCCSNECRHASYKNRDCNAALNIAKCFYSRPQILSRDLSNGKLEFKFFNLNRRQDGRKITEK
jgi:hypothetical protein